MMFVESLLITSHVKTPKLTVIGLLLGHYYSDGVHPDAEMDDHADRWLTYDDQYVRDTTGAAVCVQRRHAAYILFYKRQVRRQCCLILGSQSDSDAC